MKPLLEKPWNQGKLTDYNYLWRQCDVEIGSNIYYHVDDELYIYFAKRDITDSICPEIINMIKES
jgi:hypothetical protein